MRFLTFHAQSICSHSSGTSATFFRSCQIILASDPETVLERSEKMCPAYKPPTPQWSLQLVLWKLVCPPFEPLATTSLKLLTLKTSAQRSGELTALWIEPPFLQFHPDKVTLFPDLSFLPKVAMYFHLNQPIVLPTFF